MFISYVNQAVDIFEDTLICRGSVEVMLISTLWAVKNVKKYPSIQQFFMQSNFILIIIKYHIQLQCIDLAYMCISSCISIPKIEHEEKQLSAKHSCHIQPNSNNRKFDAHNTKQLFKKARRDVAHSANLHMTQKPER